MVAHKTTVPSMWTILAAAGSLGLTLLISLPWETWSFETLPGVLARKPQEFEARPRRSGEGCPREKVASSTSPCATRPTSAPKAMATASTAASSFIQLTTNPAGNKAPVAPSSNRACHKRCHPEARVFCGPKDPCTRSAPGAVGQPPDPWQTAFRPIQPESRQVPDNCRHFTSTIV